MQTIIKPHPENASLRELSTPGRFWEVLFMDLSRQPLGFGAAKTIYINQTWDICEEVSRKLCEKWNILQTVTSVDTSEYMGLDDRTYDSLKSSIRRAVSEHQKDWDKHLEHIVYELRTTINPVTKYTPFYLMFHRHFQMSPVGEEPKGHGPISQSNEDFFLYISGMQEQRKADFFVAFDIVNYDILLQRIEQGISSGRRSLYSDSAAVSPGKIPRCSDVTETQRPKSHPSPSPLPPALTSCDLILPSSSSDLRSGATERHRSMVLTVEMAEVGTDFTKLFCRRVENHMVYGWWSCDLEWLHVGLLLAQKRGIRGRRSLYSDSAAVSPGKIPRCSDVTETQRPKSHPSPSPLPPALTSCDLILPSSSSDLRSGATERHRSMVLTVEMAEVGTDFTKLFCRRVENHVVDGWWSCDLEWLHVGLLLAQKRGIR
ncbi:gypsy retrotransposon integrase 1 [Pelobates cultripes]|uniref:Gypsy retrotransposon integrase 1 n=1 Tax=Pelobates cultripes TaxID=61616 RepID=A0AAD1RBW2_PELCU|nr:gypsy retrotransposon integrase 1 [Pelobates cultripes]